MLKGIMSWIDIVTLAVVVTVTVIYTIRGRDFLGVALFDAGAAVVAAWAAHTLHRAIAQSIGISPPVAYIILFVLLLALLLFASARLFNLIQLQFTPFNTLVSFILGIVAGWAFAYVLLEVIGLSVSPESPTADKLESSSVASEILHFSTVARTAERLDSTTLMHREPGQPLGGPKPSQVK
jgi:hypothetical protein